MQSIISISNGNLNVLSYFPELHTLQEGKKSFVVSNKFFEKKCDDISFDLFSPWTGKYRNAKGVMVWTKTHTTSTKVVLSDDGVFSLDENGLFQLNLVENKNPNHSYLKRLIAFIIDTEKNLLSNVYYEYSTEIEVTADILRKKRRVPSENAAIKEALSNRTTAEARKVLELQNIHVTSSELTSLARSVVSHVKSRKGRKPPTDISKLIDRFSTNASALEHLKPLVIERNDEKISIVQLIAYPIAFKHFVKVLPSRDELASHKHAIRQIESLGLIDAKNEFEKYLSTCNISGSLPFFGSTILIDTTFSVISGEYLTLALAVTDQFQTKTSGKNASFILGGMIHTQKSFESHELFAAFLNDCLFAEDPSKKVPSVIHDGESSFRVYQSGVVLKDSVSLRCDLHRSENMKRLFKGNTQAYKTFKLNVFGKKVLTDNGVVYKGGLLGVLNKTDFERKLCRLIEETDTHDARSWLLNTSDSLFETGSLIRKLEGGWPTQYLTTNIIEGRNAYLKQLISSPVCAHTGMDILLKLHEQEMRERVYAITHSHSSSLRTDFGYPNFKLLALSEKQAILNTFGLLMLHELNVFESYPLWFSSSDGKVERSVFLKQLKKIKHHRSENDRSCFFVEKNDVISKVILADKALVCSFPLCKKHRDFSYFLCSHALAVFGALLDNEKIEIYKMLNDRRAGRTATQVRYRTQTVTDGSKYIQRKHTQFSKNNEPRQYDGLCRLSLNTTQGFQISLEISKETVMSEDDSLNWD